MRNRFSFLWYFQTIDINLCETKNPASKEHTNSYLSKWLWNRLKLSLTKFENSSHKWQRKKSRTFKVHHLIHVCLHFTHPAALLSSAPQAWSRSDLGALVWISFFICSDEFSTLWILLSSTTITHLVGLLCTASNLPGSPYITHAQHPIRELLNAAVIVLLK